MKSAWRMSGNFMRNGHIHDHGNNTAQNNNNTNNNLGSSQNLSSTKFDNDAILKAIQAEGEAMAAEQQQHTTGGGGGGTLSAAQERRDRRKSAGSHVVSAVSQPVAIPDYHHSGNDIPVRKAPQMDMEEKKARRKSQALKQMLTFRGSSQANNMNSNREKEDRRLTQNVIYDNPAPVYKTSIDTLMKQQTKLPSLKIPHIVQVLSEAVLMLEGQEIQGIFRVPGDIIEVNKLKAQLDVGDYNIITLDVHVVAGCLKLFFRQLEPPLIPMENYDTVIQNSASLERLTEILDTEVPEHHRNVIRYLFRFLRQMAQGAEKTMMDLANLAMVFAPGFLRSPETAIMIFNSSKEREALETLLTNYDMTPYDDAYFGIGADAAPPAAEAQASPPQGGVMFSASPTGGFNAQRVFRTHSRPLNMDAINGNDLIRQREQEIAENATSPKRNAPPVLKRAQTGLGSKRSTRSKGDEADTPENGGGGTLKRKKKRTSVRLSPREETISEESGYEGEHDSSGKTKSASVRSPRRTKKLADSSSLRNSCPANYEHRIGPKVENKSPSMPRASTTLNGEPEETFVPVTPRGKMNTIREDEAEASPKMTIGSRRGTASEDSKKDKKDKKEKKKGSKLVKKGSKVKSSGDEKPSGSPVASRREGGSGRRSKPGSRSGSFSKSGSDSSGIITTDRGREKSPTKKEKKKKGSKRGTGSEIDSEQDIGDQDNLTEDLSLSKKSKRKSLSERIRPSRIRRDAVSVAEDTKTNTSDKDGNAAPLPITPRDDDHDGAIILGRPFEAKRKPVSNEQLGEFCDRIMSKFDDED